jgi:hypothetical protein
MKTLTCDICGETLTNPIPLRTYFHLVQYDVCEACHDLLEGQIKIQVRAKQPFSYDWYEQTYINSLSKAVQKGKVEKA